MMSGASFAGGGKGESTATGSPRLVIVIGSRSLCICPIRRRQAALKAETAIVFMALPAPDFERMQAAADMLVGQHDFDSFCRTQSETKNRVCTVYEARWLRESDEDACFDMAGNRFLHGMVRAVVGTLLETGRGQRPVEDMARLLAEKDRRAAGPAAPARGLVFEEVRYQGGRWGNGCRGTRSKGAYCEKLKKA